jgi:hypothetical protein
MLENSTEYFSVIISTCYKWAPVTTAWSVFRLRMEETASLCKVNLRISANILDKPKRAAVKEGSSSLRVRRGPNTGHRIHFTCNKIFNNLLTLTS